jgi:general stress protein 26
LPWSWAAERLTANKNYWVVTATRDGRPHALPVWGVWDDTAGRFAFSCGPRSRKAANIAANPHVVVAIESTVECVSVEGKATAVEGDRADFWIERYLAKYAAEAPDLSAEFLRVNRIFEVRPRRAFGIIEREDEFASRATRWRFDT